MSDESEHTHQQDQNSCTVLQVVVQFPGHPAQTQQADHLQGAEQAADALRGGGGGLEEGQTRGYYRTEESYCEHGRSALKEE